jgi:23S rRNA pseudouridine2605 synthase
MSIQEAETREGQRIAKVMARAGLCSRRDAERWIAEGRVVVNGETLTSPAYNVSEADDVLVDGQPLRAAERTRLFFFHKPKGLVTTAHDPEGRPTIFDALPEDLPRVVTVGRLDINTEGLLLLTNDGGLARVLELPATGWLRRYRVRAHGEITQEQLDALRDGVTIDGIDYRGIEAKFERQQGTNVWLTMGLREGKNREIKRVLEHLGMSVNRLIRVSFGPFELGDLPEGQVEEVRSRVLRDQLGVKLAKQAGVDFEGATETLVAPPLEAEERTRHPGDASQGPPRKRKHVSVLRSEAGKDGAGPRKRVTRTATADRKGREVQVERVSLARPAAAEPPRRAPAARGAPGERPRRGAGEGRSVGGARAGGDRPERRPARTEGERPERSFEGARGARAVGERPERRPRGDGPPKPSRFGGEGRAARPAGDRAERRPRSEGPPRERTARAEGGETRAPRNYAEKRSFGSRPTGERPERRPRSEGPPRERSSRAEGGETRAPRNYAEKRSFGSRPTGDRPERRPRGDGPPRERTARAEGGETRAPRNYAEKRSFGSRPTGDRAERRPRSDGPPRERRAEGGESRAPRSGFGEKRSFGDRPDRRPRSDAPPRERTARAEGGAPRESRAFAPRASGGQPERRPRSDGPPRTGGKGPPRGPRTPGGKGGASPRRPRD